MKRLIFLLILLSACQLKEPDIEGFYTLTSAKYGDSVIAKEYTDMHKTIKIIRDGFWIKVTYSGNPKISVENASGGTYTINNGKYKELINFYSQNNLIVGKTQEFDCKINSDQLHIEGKGYNNNCGNNCIISEVYTKQPMAKNLKDTSLEGVWKLQSSEWFGKKVEDPDFTQYKIYYYPYYVWVQYHEKGKDFIGTGGGIYTYDKNQLVEHVSYFSFYDILPYDFYVNVTKLSKDSIKQTSVNGGGKEIWRKVN